MAPKPVPRALFLPPPGRPRWVCPENARLDLLYLSWGQRRFGEYPIPVSRHHGWVYALVVRGNPIARLAEDDVPAAPGMFFVIHPDCASGWTDRPNGVAELMVWVWRTAPRCGERIPEAGACCWFMTDAPLRQRLKHSHQLCRAEVTAPGPLTKPTIELGRLELDLALARSERLAALTAPATLRLELALRWMGQNLAEANPVRALCEYLQVSPITLNRLFRQHLRESAASHFVRLKMERGRHLLEHEGASVKEAGYLLGYRHPNDFSRAMKRFCGRPPSDFVR